MERTTSLKILTHLRRVGLFFRENNRWEIMFKVNQKGRRAREAKDEGAFLKEKILAKLA